MRSPGPTPRRALLAIGVAFATVVLGLTVPSRVCRSTERSSGSRTIPTRAQPRRVWAPSE